MLTYIHIRDKFVKIFQWIWEKIETILKWGTHDIEEEEKIQRIIFTNRLSLIISALLVVISPIIHYLIRSYFITGGILIFLLGNASTTLLNKYKEYVAAGITIYSLQCLATLYFGYFLGSVIQLQFMVFYLGGIVPLLFTKKQKPLRIACFILGFVTLMALQLIYFINVSPIIPLDRTTAFIVQSIAMLDVLIIVLVISRPYLKSNDTTFILRRSNQVIKMFFSQIAHEIRTPLNAVFGAAQLLKKEIKMNPKLKEIEPLTDQLMAASNHARSIASNVLNMAQIESGQTETVETQAFLIHTFFSNIIEVNKVIAKAREIEIDLDITQMPAVIVSDTLMLNQITTNLLANAIKYGHKKSTIYLRIKKSEQNADKWMLQVENQGLGISPEKLPNIFDPFITDKKDRIVEGAGLGLYIVKKKVELLEGDITVESQERGSTTFTVNFPLRQGWLHETRIEEEDESYNFEGIKVLTAEDDPLNAIILVRFLTLHGCKAINVTNGHEVLHYVSKETFDIIIMDFHMPGLNGLETLRYLKSDPITKRVPVILATADLFKHVHDSLLAAGADAIVDKPIQHKVLLRVIKWHLQHHADNSFLS